ncbi:GtrA family protein [Paenibacillus sp. FJAT-26967]|uniref:GtrA family protein n=1 Tax=Paenibacillus sp. FJAT-26967 TaxID=1729690 RepID=UPI0008391B7D|nr:GtrA family protein [Paenibacillus sp. FJAT-26967]
MDRRKKISPELIRLFRFGIVGVSNTLVDWAVFWLLLSGLGMHYVAAQTFAYLCGTLNSFLWNRKWTFASKESFRAAEAAKFFLVNGICLASSYALLFVCRDVFGWNMPVSKLVVTVLLLMVNYAASRLWVFRSPDSASKKSSEG